MKFQFISYKFQAMGFKNRGFTLIELIVTIAIIAVLSGMVMFTVTQYVSKGQDSNIAANLAMLIPAGETYYNAFEDSYEDFCSPSNNSVINNAIAQMPANPSGYCYNEDADSASWGTAPNNGNPAGLCCNDDTENGEYWVAWIRQFQDPSQVYCVDNRGGRVRNLPYFVSAFPDDLTQCPD